MCRQRVTILKTFVIRVVIRVIPCCEGMSKGGGGMCERPHIGNLWPHIAVRGSAKDTRAKMGSGAHTPRTGMCERHTYPLDSH